MHAQHRRVAAALIAALTAASLAGCSSSASSGSKSMTIWYRPGSISDDVVKAAPKAFPSAQLKFVKTADVDAKVKAALRTNSGLPDVTTGAVEVYASAESRFVDIDEYGFGKVLKDYLPWKAALGVTGSGRRLGIPIDIGPVAFYYNTKAFAAAGLPTDPDAVGKAISTWDGYRALAVKAQKTGHFACDDAGYLVHYSGWSQGVGFYEKSGGKLVFTPQTDAIKTAFTRAADWQQSGLCAKTQTFTTDWSSGVAKGSTIGFLQPPWVGGLALRQAAPKQSGQWRVATGTPDGTASEDGSMLMVPAATKNPQLATSIAEWLTKAQNQDTGYRTDGLFPSTPASYTSADLTAKQSYYGGQQVGQLLGATAKSAPKLVKGPGTDTLYPIYEQAIRDLGPSSDASAAFAKATSSAASQFGGR